MYIYIHLYICAHTYAYTYIAYMLYIYTLYIQESVLAPEKSTFGRMRCPVTCAAFTQMTQRRKICLSM